MNISVCFFIMDGFFFNIVFREGDKCIKFVNMDYFNMVDFMLVYVYLEIVIINSKFKRMLFI